MSSSSDSSQEQCFAAGDCHNVQLAEDYISLPYKDNVDTPVGRVPVIDVAALMNPEEYSKAQWNETSTAVAWACQEWGFFQVTQHADWFSVQIRRSNTLYRHKCKYILLFLAIGYEGLTLYGTRMCFLPTRYRYVFILDVKFVGCTSRGHSIITVFHSSAYVLLYILY